MTGPADIRVMTAAQVETALAWAGAEGWNPGRHDARLFRLADPEGFLMAFVGDEPAACISVVRHGPAFGFLGLYIAAPAFRGQGIGWRLWQAGMAHLGERVVGLDGVVAQQANYARSGFVLAHRNIRFQGVPGPARPVAGRAEPVASALMPAIAAYDSACFGAPRPRFLREWLTAPGHEARVVTRQGAIAGYGVIRPCRTGHKIGPLFAEDEATAELLFQSLAATAPGAIISLDCPEPNHAARKLASRHGLEAVFETARMYRGPDPDLPLGRIFGITTFELG